VRIEREILLFELVLLSQVEPDVLERAILLVQNDANLLAASGVGGVIKDEHERFLKDGRVLCIPSLPRFRPAARPQMREISSVDLAKSSSGASLRTAKPWS